jgi:hypothetical protein
MAPERSKCPETVTIDVALSGPDWGLQSTQLPGLVSAQPDTGN